MSVKPIPKGGDPINSGCLRCKMIRAMAEYADALQDIEVLAFLAGLYVRHIIMMHGGNG